MSSIFEIAKGLGVNLDRVYNEACEEAKHKMYTVNFSYDTPIEKQKQDLINEIYIRMVRSEIISYIETAAVTQGMKGMKF
jgi:hypothetical protein